jgi:hypothetical protein
MGLQLTALPEGINWPGNEYRIESLQVLIPDDPLTSLEELTKAAAPEVRDGRGRGGLESRRGQFNAIDFKSADWSYRIERGSAGKPGTLWLTPTPEALEKARTAVAEINQAREAAEKARIEFEKARAEREQQQAPPTTGENKDGADSK